VSLTQKENVVTGAKAVDRLGSTDLEIHASTVVNATGSGIDRLLAGVRLSTGLPMIQAMNFVTTRTARPYGFSSQSSTGRNLFAVPYQGQLLIGTWESRTQATPGEQPSGADVDAFLAEINSAFREMKLRRDEIALIHHGVVPGLRLPDGSYALDGHEQIHDHALSGVEGLISVAGTKYTTARRVAEHVVNEVVAKRGIEVRACRTAELPLPIGILAGDEGLRAAARDEMTHTLEDVVLRRTGLGAVGNPGDEVLAHAADVVGEVKGWDMLRRRAEVAALRETYGKLKA
jgi:glycerol-3-phosphate dehydrogenase